MLIIPFVFSHGLITGYFIKFHFCSPKAELVKSLQKNDYRLLAIREFSYDFPGVNITNKKSFKNYTRLGWRTIPFTSDFHLIGDTYYDSLASSYASEYNKLLIDELVSLKLFSYQE